MPRLIGATLGLLLGLSSLVSTTSALAQSSTRYELDTAAPLSADGWTFNAAEATSLFGISSLQLASTRGYAEWLLREATDKPLPTTGWLGNASPGRGWWVEARVRVTTASNCQAGGPGLLIDDGKSAIRIQFDAASVLFVGSQRHDVPTTVSEFHVYRLQRLSGRHFQLLIDGAIAVDELTTQNQGAGKALMFGDLGGCDATDTTWDYVAYDTFGPSAAAADDDSDGVTNAVDDCVLLANADQADGDHDAVGDACDVCPLDPDNDQDGDGVCGDQDACPTDGRNDQDKDGVCDTIECAPFQTPSTQLGRVCPVICNCFTLGNDPVGGFGNVDNWGGGGFGLASGGTGTGTNGGASGSGALGGNQSSGGFSISSAGSNHSTAGSSQQTPSSSASGSETGSCACRFRRCGADPFSSWLALGALSLAIARRGRGWSSSPR
jgi:hypothetical protein